MLAELEIFHFQTYKNSSAAERKGNSCMCLANMLNSHSVNSLNFFLIENINISKKLPSIKTLNNGKLVLATVVETF